MENKNVIKLGKFIKESYECNSFENFLKHTILNLHELIMYDSGMFFCAISKDCSFFKPYISGKVEDFYNKESFSERENYLKESEELGSGKESYVYKATDFVQGIIKIANEPRSGFLFSQDKFYIVCIRIIYNGQFMGEIYLHRSKDKPDFDDNDLFMLNILQPQVSTVFNIIHTITTIKYLETEGNSLSKKGLCLLDSDLSLISSNVTAIEMLRQHTVFGSSVLYHIKEICEYMATQHSKILNNKSTSLKVGSSEIQVNIIYKNNSKNKNDSKFFIYMEYENPEITGTEYKFKFSAREGEIIDGIIQGKNNNQLANSLNLSENTIKTHIKNIYRKTGVANRTELTYILMLNNEQV